MAGKTVDTESLGQAAAALGTYIADVRSNIQKMNDAAQDCSDNMGSDVYSNKAIANLQTCAKELSKTFARQFSQRKSRLKTLSGDFKEVATWRFMALVKRAQMLSSN